MAIVYCIGGEMMDSSKRIDNTVKVISEILEKHKDKEELKFEINKSFAIENVVYNELLLSLTMNEPVNVTGSLYCIKTILPSIPSVVILVVVLDTIDCVKYVLCC